MESFSVLLVGCGNIAGGYDLLQAEDDLPLGHAKAFAKHGGFTLAACVEPNSARRAEFQQRWNVADGFSSMKELVDQACYFDVISICSPTHSHAVDIEFALTLKPKLIFCEKPVTLSLTETDYIVKACAAQGILLAVNYSRRWSPEVLQIKAELTDGEWGRVRSVSASYNKGILNNGSHMIDMLHFLFGSLQIISVGHPVNDFFSDDPTVDVSLRTDQRVPILINVAHANDYTLFEMQIVTEKGVINMEDGGARWRFRNASPSNKLSGYSFLNMGEWITPKGSYALTGAVSNLFDTLKKEEPLASTGTNALQAQSVCERIKQMAMKHVASQINEKENYER